MADKIYKLHFAMSDGGIKSVQFTAPQGPQGEKGATGATGAAIYLIAHETGMALTEVLYSNIALPDDRDIQVGDLLLSKNGYMYVVSSTDRMASEFMVDIAYVDICLKGADGEGAVGTCFCTSTANGSASVDEEGVIDRSTIWMPEGYTLKAGDTVVTADGHVNTVNAVDGSTVYLGWEGVRFMTAQPDWNAAAGENGHVLNRTHYAEYADTVLLAETVAAFSADTEYAALFPDLVLTAGTEYAVTWDGVVYTGTAYTIDTGVALGNRNAFNADLESSGEPFALAYVAGTGMMVMPYALFDGSAIPASVTLSITAHVETVHKLSSKWYDAAYYVEVTCNDDGTYTTPETVDGLEAAYQAGLPVFARITLPTDNTTVTTQQRILPLTERVPYLSARRQYYFTALTVTTGLLVLILTEKTDGYLSCAVENPEIGSAAETA